MKSSVLTFIFIFSFLKGSIVLSQEAALRFEKITVDDGLSQNTVYSILKDKKGFMWFGTTGGLNRFDGYDIKAYKNIPNNSLSISSNAILCLHEDKDSTLWIGTLSGGINKYNQDQETFEALKVPGTEAGINNILSIFEDDSGNLYFGTQGAGIIFLNKKANKLKVFKSPLFDDNPVYANTVMDFLHHNNQLWVITIAGIQKVDTLGNFEPVEITFNRPSLEFISIFKDKKEVIWVATTTELGRLKQFPGFSELEFPFKELDDTRIIAFEEDADQNLWIATYGKGLAVINKERTKIEFYRKELSNPQSLVSDGVATLYKDNSNIIWIGGLGGGINKYDKAARKFGNYQDFYSDNITSLIEDKKGNVWFASGPKGVTRWNPSTNTVRNFFNNDFWQIGLCEDNYGSIWSIDLTKGLSRFSEEQQKFLLEVKFDKGYSIINGPDGKIYAITLGKYLKAIDPKTLEIEEIAASKHLERAYCLIPGKNNNMWLGGKNGILGELDLSSRNVMEHQLEFQGASLESILVSIIEDGKGQLWIATVNKGIFLVDKQTKKVLKHYGEPNGMSNSDVKAILEDNRGHIWISTNNGLSVLNPSTGKIKTYTTLDGLVHNEFNSFAAFKNKEGKLYFGGMEGFNCFYPEQIEENKIIPPVVITDFRLFNKSVLLDPDSDNDSLDFFLKSSITNNKRIELLHSQNVFSFQFAALNFSLPKKNKYAYKMEGFDKDWIYCGNTRTVTYTNLNPGNYLFKVKASNNDGVWNEDGASIGIIIHPPYWKTWWAYFAYVLIAFVLIRAGWKYFTAREKLQNDLKLKSLESQKLQEVDEIKTRFYTNVSHEFRTPLTLILGPLETALSLSKSRGEKDIRQNLELVSRNAERLLELINQLMDFSKLESGNMRLHLEEADVVEFLRGCTLSFSSLALSNGIALKFITTFEFIIASFDRDKLKKIVNNLLSNALKFTREGGSVEVLVDYNEKDLVLQVTDDGIGIPEENLENIFNRFYQVENISKTFPGSGIGLALLKELVAFHNGNVQVQSSKGKGTLFSFYLPIEIIKVQKTTENKQIVFHAGGTSESIIDVQKENHTSGIKEKQAINQETKISEQRKNSHVILVVEDNHEIRDYIRSAFEMEYKILEAENGKMGLSTAEVHIPDLVITDIMMPEMNGQELCKILKANEKTSHIPVIMLTAKATQEDKIEGFETGADAYIIKPFHLKELKVKVKNLIAQKEKLRKRYTGSMALQPREIAVTSADENFLNKCLDVIERNMSNSTFSVDDFGKEVGMSRSQLHRKLKALIDQSTSEFIRNIRLKRASELIKKGYGNTAEVAYEVGFNSVSYFIKCYKEVYGNTPSKADKN